ncbi:MAG: hypothetical protein J6I68_00160 [Butyrivibrio sp.]|uniref:hypothetical protein n=1 Tax=Butyrivibrio sp. TaxID=28121 RepID=UPI001B517032|nr:hypothetical protein [Butyrivibrio sp.]MBP3781641.1 hypothetical protein [Butyrivibrio sp.]
MMNKIVDFAAFRKDVEEALVGVGKKYGVDIKAANISYDENTFDMKLKATRTDVDVEKLEFENNLKFMEGFTMDDYHASLKIKGRTYTLVGFKPYNKYDVILERDDGKRYGFVSKAVVYELGRHDKAV